MHVFSRDVSPSDIPLRESPRAQRPVCQEPGVDSLGDIPMVPLKQMLQQQEESDQAEKQSLHLEVYVLTGIVVMLAIAVILR